MSNLLPDPELSPAKSSVPSAASSQPLTARKDCIRQEIKLVLTRDEINRILSALGSQAYQDVFQLVNKIQQQAQAQLESQPPA